MPSVENGSRYRTELLNSPNRFHQIANHRILEFRGEKEANDYCGERITAPSATYRVQSIPIFSECGAFLIHDHPNPAFR